MKSYPEKSFSLNFGYPFASRGCLQFRLGNVLSKVRLYFSWYLLSTTAKVNKPNRSCYYVQKGHGFWENIVSVNNSFHISYFYVCWSVVTRGCVFSAVCPKNNNVGLTRYKWLKKWKIQNIDLTLQFSLSILTNFRYQSIKITWLLSIFMDNDFYRLTTPGQTGNRKNIGE